MGGVGVGGACVGCCVFCFFAWELQSGVWELGDGDGLSLSILSIFVASAVSEEYSYRVAFLVSVSGTLLNPEQIQNFIVSFPKSGDKISHLQRVVPKIAKFPKIATYVI